jgi:hypothetical protein
MKTKTLAILMAAIAHASGLSGQSSAASNTPVPAPAHIIISERAQNSFSFLYENVQLGAGKEFFGCLIGTINNDSVTIDHVAFPFIVRAARDSVRVDDCDMPGVVGWSHSHPQQAMDNCHHSHNDWQFWRENDYYLIAVLVCDSTRTRFYTRGDIPERSATQPIPVVWIDDEKRLGEECARDPFWAACSLCRNSEVRINFQENLFSALTFCNPGP